MATKAPATKSHGRSVLKIYFLIMTLVGVIGTLITFGILAFTGGKQLIITDEEYIVGDRYYELDSCKYNDYDGKESTPATTEEIQKCETEKKDMLIKSRKVMFKQDMLGASIR
jgi:hypothetical protein